MIKKLQTLQLIEKEAFVLVLRTNTDEQGIEVANASIDGGCNVIEVTFTIPNAERVISELAKQKREGVVIGAGTVLDSETARIAILAGAMFIVSPSFNEETAKLCNRYGIPYIPGCFTVKEIVEAIECGVDVVKLFPGSAFKPSIIKDIKSPIKNLSVMVSGGVNYENIEQWMKCGCDVISIGSAIVNLATTELVREETKKYVSLIKQLKG